MSTTAEGRAWRLSRFTQWTEEQNVRWVTTTNGKHGAITVHRLDCRVVKRCAGAMTHRLSPVFSRDDYSWRQAMNGRDPFRFCPTCQPEKGGA